MRPSKKRRQGECKSEGWRDELAGRSGRVFRERKQNFLQTLQPYNSLYINQIEWPYNSLKMDHSSSWHPSDCDSAPNTRTQDCSPPLAKTASWQTKGKKCWGRVQSYQWSDDENRKYLSFLVKMQERDKKTVFGSKIRRINIQMSKAVKTRTPVQCRSHNQKMLKRLGSLDNIITHFQLYFAHRQQPQQQTATGGPFEVEKGKEGSGAKTGDRAGYIWPITKWDLLYCMAPLREGFSQDGDNN